MPVQTGLLVPDDLSMKGNQNRPHTLVERLQLIMDNSSQRVLIPLENLGTFSMWQRR